MEGRGRGVEALDGDGGGVWGGGEGMALGVAGGRRSLGTGALLPLSADGVETGGDAVRGVPAGAGGGALEETCLVRERIRHGREREGASF